MNETPRDRFSSVAWGIHFMDNPLKKRIRLLTQALCHTHDRYLCDCHGTTTKNAEQLTDFFKQLDSATDTDDHTITQHVLSDTRVREIEQTLRNHTSKAEYALELYWAKRIATSADPKTTLKLFPFFAQYQDMLRSNYHALRMCTDQPLKRVLFVGSGPLPLSALLLKLDYGVDVECVDYDTQACEVSQALFSAFDLGNTPIHACNVLDMNDLHRFDAVILAALVGENAEQKQMVVRHLHTALRPGAMLLARAAMHLKTLCYPAMKNEDLPGFTVRAHIHHPARAGINSIFVGENQPS